MDLGQDLQGGEKWPLSEVLVRRLWKFAKLAEWSEWNSKWRARCCPMCGGPESYRQHADYCPLFIALGVLEKDFPQVTQPLPMDPITEIEAKEWERLLLGGIQKAAGEEKDRNRPFWEE